jgi:signal transduction histidine kinase
VTVTVEELPDGFYIEDDGPGIPPENRDSIFEAGFTTNSDENGFGLAIVAEIVAGHGWEIDVAEGTDGGARLEIRTE